MSGLPHLAQLDDIHEFGRQTVARSMLPVLVRRIIAQSNDSVTMLQMAGDEDTDLGGYDGIVSAGRGDAFVPAGRSVWEFGASGDPGAKAQADYRKRTNDALGEDPAITTFVFVTPHRWPGAEAWAKKKRAEEVWRDVRVYTANDILTALEGVPAVHLWFSEFRGKPANGAASLDSWWSRFQKPTKGLLTPEFVLSGREDASAQLLRTLTNQDSSHLWVRAATTDDVLAFVAATLVANGRTTENNLLSRALVVYEPGVLRYLDNTANLLILVPFTESLVREADLVTEHHVILMTTDVGSAVIDLPSIPIDAAAKLLKAQSVPDAAALEYARAAFRSLPLFRSIVQGVKLASGQFAAESIAISRVVRRAWFLGRWSGRRSGDAQVVACLTNASSDELTSALEKYASGADPVFSRVGDTWAVIGPAASAGRISPAITSADFAAFETVVQNVLGAVDPALSLPAKDRWSASLYGKSREHSSDLRSGIATSLAMFGSLDQSVVDQTSLTLRGWAAQIVRAVLGRANEDASGDLWLSLADLLPKLAEAAPEEVLAALRTGIQPAGSLQPRLFADSPDLFASNSPHVYVLWALERLAWSSDYFGAALQVLALMASLDPGGKLSKRPLSSLASILRAWHPQTVASRADRNAAARVIARKFPAVGGQLAVALIPEPSEVTGETATPEFRKWRPDNAERQVTTPELVEDIKFYTGLAVSLTASDPSLWLKLVPKLPDLPIVTRAEVLDQLTSRTIEPVEVRTSVWAALSDLIRQHEQFAESQWALPPAQINRLRSAAAALAPSDIVSAVEWLFGYTPFVGVPETDFENYDAAVREAQERAVEEVFESGGLDAVVRLVRAAKNPSAVGYVFAHVGSDVPLLTIAKMLDDEASEVRNFAAAAVGKGTERALDKLLPLARALDASAAAKARVLLGSDDLERTWAELAAFDRPVEDAYWAEFSGLGRGSNFHLVRESAQGLADHGRVAAALDLLAMYSYRSDSQVDPQLVAELLGRLLAAEDPEIGVLAQHDFDRLIGLIRSAPSVDDETVATLEWSFLPALAQHEDSLTLQRRLAKHPAFFADVVSIVFRATEAEPVTVQPKASEAQAMNGWRLLRAWRVVPGTDQETGTVDPTGLATWVTEARRVLAERGRADVGDSQIGQVFAYAPMGADGFWPCEPVRDLIENLNSEHINSGFVVGIHNKRGMWSRSPDEGGAQEYALEHQYNDWAQALAIEWPLVASMLRDVANSYHAEGVRADEEAQRYREGLNS